MSLQHEICPNCKTLQLMRITESKIEKKDEHKFLVVRTVHCTNCSVFVRCEEFEEDINNLG